ncbi:hypothetical protein J3E73DRAFT_252372 [Bipolaris maydis]|nr:hypothetical protein J3E73DRAFT_252372 [Bipolaris maydis]
MLPFANSKRIRINHFNSHQYTKAWQIVNNSVNRQYTWLQYNDLISSYIGGAPYNEISLCALFFPDGPNRETVGAKKGRTAHALNEYTVVYIIETRFQHSELMTQTAKMHLEMRKLYQGHCNLHWLSKPHKKRLTGYTSRNAKVLGDFFGY